ncbi:bifunctional 5,10-methylenetetrahydrofolate dehydrogenase/5,10-methenyltetrahydrofolate cyclohydrolase [Merdimmobilis hominis]|jgi:methylenetetrahydrofolate dehydrogenase (NADP+)/methenyltetrahydrofolate cyclohydrolase|uniref:Bifunctional protein FolD n=1 Tax=uncultured Anaerotruncus sp. TaxID=905011 RepID=A0A6N2U5E2_9FIRM|nr:bifunctional 5,10-methylenetetrahydrofolate dehydrogenase/5,10-methenyltetrahydrofolate cyclohydrolase [Merdimmobilis hominis]MCD4835498.1 bifunctional 5,10-methylenetetrahydrofolate dehydrogenase/5,10-methenyltetrahydrofolate cyclohydrolase [Merdimmobilis hominis]PWL57493.1 MAG: bifunctional 5,10-methylenetetrahydrofolate dehydrogenase/5,10-methenyltetrahydrofolate cyclohydrolase [Oscillospiraceae bacterium]PWL57497.1 MAG: bifunctional 5,10-methylenetetrahydrofolate dehydrogenase/5,10-methen
MATILKGAAVTAALNQSLTERTSALKEKGILPTLAIVRVGERGDDISYEKGAIKRCEKIGVGVKQFLLPADVPEETLLATIEEINADPAIHGCLLFRPLPGHIDGERIRRALAPQKDVDGITDGSLAGVFSGSGEGYPPCTAQACMEILDHYGYPLQGKKAVVVGRSLVVGKPAAMLLLQKNATVTVCHTRTADMPALCREAEVLIVAAGKAGVVGKEYLSPGQVVIDVGIHVLEDGKLTGDVKFEEAEPIVEAITPVPGGVGTVTTSVLVKHVVEAAEKASK